MPWDLHHHYNYKVTARLAYSPSAWKNAENLSWATKETAKVAYGVMGNYWSQFNNGSSKTGAASTSVTGPGGTARSSMRYGSG